MPGSVDEASHRLANPASQILGAAHDRHDEIVMRKVTATPRFTVGDSDRDFPSKRIDLWKGLNGEACRASDKGQICREMGLLNACLRLRGHGRLQ